MRYILGFVLFSIFGISEYSKENIDSFDLEISIEPVTDKSLQDGQQVILEIKVTNISKIKCPENAYKFTLFVNDKLVGLDNSSSELKSLETITYTKDIGSYHFIAHKDSSYNISAKVDIKKGFEDLDLSNNQIKKILVAK